MAGRTLALLLALVAVASSSNVQFFRNRIVGGDVAPQGLAPWAVSLRSGVLIKSHFCGGTIVTPKFIVTAAHCVDAVYSGGSLASSLQVLSGTLSQNEGGVKSTVARNFTRADWDSYNIKNDIGIFELTTALVLDTVTQPIPINSAYVDTASLTAVGWGLTRYPGISSSTVLKYLVTPSISHDDCVSRRDVQAALTTGFFPAISTGEICTLHSVGQAVCQGDSGSALFDDVGLVGVVSWGVACATGFPDVFTRVSAYSEWVNGIIA